MTKTCPPITALRITLHGQVQGVGLRPAVARLAAALQLTGFVRNSADGVQLQIEGDTAAVEQFQQRLSEHLPSIACASIADATPCEASGTGRFLIVESLSHGPLTTRVPRDLAACPECLQDVLNAADRRREDSFASCTNCGPRYSLIDELPYDRCRTSMAVFEQCAVCGSESANPEDRRFHSQTNSCPDCGPSLSFFLPEARNEVRSDAARSDEPDPLAFATKAILAGGILALRGVGGYQLVVDATNSEAIDRLRERKRRPAKPLAVMVQSLAEAQHIANLSPIERATLSASDNPIVLVTKRADQTGKLGDGIHPGLREVGLFLPTTPLHRLLLDRVGRPLVVTSGNVDDEPLVVERKAAERELEAVADAWLHHDREIVRPIDDSVVRVIADRPVTIRNARGLAPLPLPAIEQLARRILNSNQQSPVLLAVGGHQKNAVALLNGQQAVLAPHLGNLNSVPSRMRFVEQLEQLTQLYRCQAKTIVHDLHPDYFSTQWARRFEQTLAVQHHHAHVVSAMVENDWLDRKVLGVAFDGTGYGSDGSIWGGEFLRATVQDFERVGHLRPFRLPGGEAAILEPWRVAASLLVEAVGTQAASRFLNTVHPEASDRLQATRPLAPFSDPHHPTSAINTCRFDAVVNLASGTLAPMTTSAGRLFDGVASLILGIGCSNFEGQPAMLLESAVDISALDAYEFAVTHDTPLQIDWRPMVRQVLADRQKGCPPGVMAARFHRGLAIAIAGVARQFRLPIVLTGGVFQNRLLTEWALDELADQRCLVGRHAGIPPNDGGLAAGQLAIGLARLGRNRGSI
jgi:hydrogenase maturation protein HypF